MWLISSTIWYSCLFLRTICQRDCEIPLIAVTLQSSWDQNPNHSQHADKHTNALCILCPTTRQNLMSKWICILKRRVGIAEVNIARHLADLGIEEEFGNHAHMRGLSGGQKVKVVLAAATWLNPHIIVLVRSWSYSFFMQFVLIRLPSQYSFSAKPLVPSSHDSLASFCLAICTPAWHVNQSVVSDVHRMSLIFGIFGSLGCQWLSNAGKRLFMHSLIAVKKSALISINEC